MRTWRPPIPRCPACRRFLYEDDRLEVDRGICYCYECGPPRRRQRRFLAWLRWFYEYFCLGRKL